MKEDNIGRDEEGRRRRESERLIASIPERIYLHYSIGFSPKKYVGIAVRKIFSPEELDKMKSDEHAKIRRLDK